MEYVLTTDSLKKKYGGFTALSNVSVHIPKGTVYGLVGRSGAGKTTLLRLVCGLQNPTRGSYTLFGRRHDDREIAKSRRRTGAVVGQPAVYPSMTAAENLQVQYRMLGMPSFGDIPELLALTGLERAAGLKARTFSADMRKRLGIALALAGSPDFLILDEPADGLDLLGVMELRELILKLNRERQLTVLVASHTFSELSRLATHYGFLDKGLLLREMRASELEADRHRHTCLTVGDSRPLCAVLDQRKLSYRIFSDTYAEIYSQINVAELVQALSCAGCEILSIQQREEEPEHYLLNLLGKNAPDGEPNQRTNLCD